MRLLLTGGCGFIGHHFVEAVIKNTDWEIVILDKLSYASKGFDRLRDISCYDNTRIHRLAADFTLPIVDGLADEIGEVDYIIHMGAATHVENSISDPRPFVYSNVLGTMEMLEFAKTKKNLKKFVYFSTDEVFGPATTNADELDTPRSHLGLFQTYREWDRYNSTNPYSATKAAGEELCLAWANTYGVPVIITHTMNCFGERQHPEKFIPMCIKKILSDETISVHSNKERTKAGSRFWIHCRNVAAAVMFLLDRTETREKYNIVGEKEVDNLTMAHTIGNILGVKAKCELVDFHSSRPGHDLRYALDGSKMASMGWQPPIGFEDSLERTIHWYLDHPQWLSWEKERRQSWQSEQTV